MTNNKELLIILLVVSNTSNRDQCDEYNLKKY